MMDPIQSIFHEKQEGSLCAQHCLNTLLQGQYFSPVDLAEIARQLDDSEREKMAEGGTQTDEYRSFIKQPSSNFDDSGFFSIQVISSALRVWNLEVIPFSSRADIAVYARQNPVTQRAFICNFRHHWFTIRKVGRQWFNLNSLLSGPELISDTYLSLFLTQLQQEGYSIFVLVGDLPNCDADEVLKTILVDQPIKPHILTDSKSTNPEDDDIELQQAIAESRGMDEKDDLVLQQTLSISRTNEEEALLRQALEMSMLDQPCSSTSPNQPPKASNTPDVRQQRLGYLSTANIGIQTKTTQTGSTTSVEEEMLQEAIKMSMQQP